MAAYALLRFPYGVVMALPWHAVRRRRHRGNFALRPRTIVRVRAR